MHIPKPLVLRRPVEQSDVDGWIDEGRGAGRFDRYLPWVTIGRHFSSPVSFQHFHHLPIRSSNFHYLSNIEYRTGLKLTWTGAQEIREGLPLWNFDHPHPNSGLDEGTALDRTQVEGLYWLAKREGIDIGTFPGSQTFFTASCDHVAMLPGRHLLFVSNKPKEVLKKFARARERVALDRVYARSVGGKHVQVTDEGVGAEDQLVANLHWLSPLKNELVRLTVDPSFPDYCQSLDVLLRTLPICDAIEVAARQYGLDCEEAQLRFRAGCWLAHLKLDLTEPLILTRFAVFDAGACRQRLREQLWGKKLAKELRNA